AIQEILKAQKAGINPAIEISVEKALLRCRTCGEEWGFEKRRDRLDMVKLESIHFLPEAAKAYLRCPCCKSPDFEVAKGRGIWIEEIKTE
ncbi:MAG TPA: hydrogenase nickel insertion protein HypA, partial [Candidatus Omnitrophica bacterium]|nr:hydrogenase nickel insertion protein HypA [Candidatus Omnitrophota bacterium]